MSKTKSNSLIDAKLREIYDKSKDRKALSSGFRELEHQSGLSVRTLTRRAHTIGLVRTQYKRWTAAEDQFMRDYAGEMKPTKMAKTLGRSLKSLKYRMFVLELSCRTSSDGFSYRDLSKLLGVSCATISTWVKKHMLTLDELGGISYRSVQRFVLQHFNLLSLRRVDEAWLKLIMAEALPKRYEVAA